MKVQHPEFPDLVRDVVNGESWLASGWREVRIEIAGEKRPEVFATKPSPKKRT